MTTEMIVNVSPRETRAALLENGVLQELFVERASRMGLTGNLYKGRVSRVLPGMQAAFIDIGLERTAFLHVSDIVQPADAEGSGEETRTENIRELVSEGGDILVQVLKDPLGTKGARLTTFHHDTFALPRLHAIRPRRRHLRAHRDGGRANFCSNCGSGIYTDGGDNYYVAAGVLRDLELKPAFHIQVAYKAPWDEIGGNAPQFPEYPPHG